MEDGLNVIENDFGMQYEIWRTNSTFLKWKTASIFDNGRRPHFFKIKDDLSFEWKSTSNTCRQPDQHKIQEEIVTIKQNDIIWI
jgi:hypothetical protein